MTEGASADQCQCNARKMYQTSQTGESIAEALLKEPACSVRVNGARMTQNAGHKLTLHE